MSFFRISQKEWKKFIVNPSGLGVVPSFIWNTASILLTLIPFCYFCLKVQFFISSQMRSDVSSKVHPINTPWDRLIIMIPCSLFRFVFFLLWLIWRHHQLSLIALLGMNLVASNLWSDVDDIHGLHCLNVPGRINNQGMQYYSPFQFLWNAFVEGTFMYNICRCIFECIVESQTTYFVLKNTGTNLICNRESISTFFLCHCLRVSVKVPCKNVIF